MSPEQIILRLHQSLPRLSPLLQEDVPLNELALDSMDTVELLCAIHEEFGVRITDGHFQPSMTLYALAEHVSVNSTVKA